MNINNLSIKVEQNYTLKQHKSDIISEKSKITITKTILVSKPGLAGSVSNKMARKKQIKMTPKLKQALADQAQSTRTSQQTANNSNLSFNKDRKLTNEIEGEKYLIVHRTDDGSTMKDMSPILLEKAFQTVTNNGKITCRTLKSGDIMIKTENVKQAKSLITLTKISHANIEVTEHKTLNSCKGVVSAYELKYEDSETLLEYLKTQHVTKVDFHTKLINNERIKTGLVFVTFGKTELPEYLRIGCLRLNVRPFIPPPMRCFICHKFGHISKTCPNQSNPKCYNCYEDKHIHSKDEKCTEQQKCINCGGNDHNSYNRLCVEYNRQVNIQTIKVTQNVSFAEAVKRSNLQRRTYAQVTTSNDTNKPSPTKCGCPHCGYHNLNIQKRNITNYGDLNENDKMETQEAGSLNESVAIESMGSGTSASQQHD